MHLIVFERSKKRNDKEGKRTNPLRELKTKSIQTNEKLFVQLDSNLQQLGHWSSA